MKGSYILLIKLNDNKIIKYGSNKKKYFKKGFYAYIGSALNSIEKRIERHLRDKKNKHWHIDYLLNYTEIAGVFYKENNFKEECKIANSLKINFSQIDGFGSTDCNCKGHIFYGKRKNFIEFMSKNNMKKYKQKT